MKKSLILVLLGLLLYGFSLSNGFVWDDEVYLQQNPATSFEGKSALSTDVYFRPVMTGVYSFLYSTFGPTPFVFHLASVAFHIGTVLLLYILFRRFFSDKIAFILSLIYLIHPANVEAVCFASSLQEILFTFTGVLGMNILVKSSDVSIHQILFSLICFTLALLMKETAIVFFVLAFIYILLYHRKDSNTILLFAAFSLFAVFSYGMARFGNGNTYVQGPGLFPIMRVPFGIRLLSIPQIIFFYISTFFFPLNLAIAQHWVIRSVSIREFWGPLGIVVGLFILLFYSLSFLRRQESRLIFQFKKGDFRLDPRLRGDDVFLFFFLWFLIGLLPHLQIVPLNMTVAERWLYFPMIGLLGMGGAMAQGLKFKVQSSKFKVGIGLLIILLFIRSFTRTLDWHTGLRLYSSTISETSSFDMQNNMGVELFRVGKYDEAKKYFEKSTKLAPYWWVNWNNVGAAYERDKNYKKAAESYEKSIQNGTYILAYENLARILVTQGKDKKKAEEFLSKALTLFPSSPTLLYLKKNIQ